ncbi:MAG: GNAT family N-acetyltransferase [Phycisphaerae bacterium]|nr:GNAT family N-acetyltransferase [Phycisphaerae bacterium]
MHSLRPFDAKRDTAAISRAITLAFAGTPDGVLGYFDLVGRENLRVLDEGPAAPTACLARIPMGHWFGGRVVPTIGIAAVAVAPEARGSGRAKSLMEEAVREAARDGTPLLSLFASTQALYRKVGFEQAGSKFETSMPLRQLHTGTRALSIEPVTALMHGNPNERLVRCYQRYASAFEGCLERGPFIWKRIQQNRDQTFHGFAVVPDGPGGDVEGYVFIGQVRRDGGRHDVVLSDLAFTTERAALRLLGLLSDYTTMGLTLSFIGGPCHPLVALLPQQWIEMQFKDYWMVRIADLGAAVNARGFASSIELDIVLDVSDDLVPANAGRWRLRVSGGLGSVARTDSPAVFHSDIRALAAIYTGFLSPKQAVLLGHARGDERAARALGGAFAGTAPWMVDHF